VSLADAVAYGKQIAEALAHAHERGVIHRDLKSANLMVTPQGQVKVLDFGLARRGQEVSSTTGSGLPTMTVAVAGTPAYMAPETLRGAPADRASDIWSLGVVLYEMVAGRRPFDGETAFEVTSAILRDAPRAIPARVPAPMKAVIARCLAKDPAMRYRQASEVGAALEVITLRTSPPAEKVKPRSRSPKRPPRPSTSRRSKKGLPH
jgi:serine/threonine-protein kinase